MRLSEVPPGDLPRCCPSPPGTAAQAVAPTRLLGEAWRVNEARFADGVRYRIEIPSVEGPEVFRAVLDEAAGAGRAGASGSPRGPA